MVSLTRPHRWSLVILFSLSSSISAGAVVPTSADLRVNAAWGLPTPIPIGAPFQLNNIQVINNGRDTVVEAQLVLTVTRNGATVFTSTQIIRNLLRRMSALRNCTGIILPEPGDYTFRVEARFSGASAGMTDTNRANNVMTMTRNVALQSADIAITGISVPEQITIGRPLPDVTATLRNHGPTVVSISHMVLTILRDGGIVDTRIFACYNLASGQQADHLFSGLPFADAGEYTFQCEARFSGASTALIDENAANNTRSEIRSALLPVADLEVTEITVPATIIAGQSYANVTASLRNNGPYPVTACTFTSTLLRSGNQQINQNAIPNLNLASGQQSTLVFRNPFVAEPGEYTFSLEVALSPGSSPTIDTNPANNVKSVNRTVAEPPPAAADLEVVHVGFQRSPNLGPGNILTMRIRNNGPATTPGDGVLLAARLEKDGERIFANQTTCGLALTPGAFWSFSTPPFEISTEPDVYTLVGEATLTGPGAALSDTNEANSARRETASIGLADGSRLARIRVARLDVPPAGSTNGQTGFEVAIANGDRNMANPPVAGFSLVTRICPAGNPGRVVFERREPDLSLDPGQNRSFSYTHQFEEGDVYSVTCQIETTPAIVLANAATAKRTSSINIRFIARAPVSADLAIESVDSLGRPRVGSGNQARVVVKNNGPDTVADGYIFVQGRDAGKNIIGGGARVGFEKPLKPGETVALVARDLQVAQGNGGSFAAEVDFAGAAAGMIDAVPANNRRSRSFTRIEMAFQPMRFAVERFEFTGRDQERVQIEFAPMNLRLQPFQFTGRGFQPITLTTRPYEFTGEDALPNDLAPNNQEVLR